MVCDAGDISIALTHVQQLGAVAIGQGSITNIKICMRPQINASLRMVNEIIADVDIGLMMELIAVSGATVFPRIVAMFPRIEFLEHFCQRRVLLEAPCCISFRPGADS